MAIKNYNRYRGSEAHAKIIDIRDSRVTIEVRGSFCETCGYYDWIEDLIYEMEEFGIKAKITNIIELIDGAIVSMDIKEEG